METVIKQKPKSMEHHYGNGIFGLITSALAVMFVTWPHKIMAFLLDGVSIINPNVKQFMIDIAPFIGVISGLVIIIVNVLKAVKYFRQIREMKNNNEKKQ